MVVFPTTVSGHPLKTLSTSRICASHPLFFSKGGSFILAVFFKLKIFRPSTPADEFQGKLPMIFVQDGVVSNIFALFQWRRADEIFSRCEKLSDNSLRACSSGFTVPVLQTTR